MSKYSFLGLAAIFLAAGNAAKAYAEGTEEPAAPAGGGEAEATTKRRGRPPGGAAAAADPAPPADDPAARLAANKELVKALVEGGQGADVKKVVAKYTEGTLKDLPADKQAAFEKDIEALSI